MLGEALVAACSDPRVLANIAGPIGDAARTALATLPRDRAGAKTRRATWAATARAPVPSGLRGAHPSWIEAGLVGLPPRARTDVATGGRDPVGVWLARWACARIPPLPSVRSDSKRIPITHPYRTPAPDILWRPPKSIDEALSLDAPDLRAWLYSIGSDQVAALAIGGNIEAPPLHEAMARARLPPRAGALGPMRAILERCTNSTFDDVGLIRIGARTIAPYVALRPLARLILMCRLPRPLGLAVGEELHAHATDSIERCPSWIALAAE